MPSPRAIYEELGENLTRALLDGDFQRYCSVTGLPLEIAPQDGQPYTLTTLADLEEDFLLYHRNVKLHRVTDMYRENIEATQNSSDQITARFKIHILAGAQELVPPFVQVHVLKRMPEGWRVRHIISALGHINWTLGRADISSGAFVPQKPNDGSP